MLAVLPVLLTQDFTHSVLVTRVTSSTRHQPAVDAALLAADQSHVLMFCSVLHVVTQPRQCPVATNMGQWREAEVCRGGELVIMLLPHSHQRDITGTLATLATRQSPPPATCLQVLSDFLSPVSVSGSPPSKLLYPKSYKDGICSNVKHTHDTLMLFCDA